LQWTKGLSFKESCQELGITPSGNGSHKTTITQTSKTSHRQRKIRNTYTYCDEHGHPLSAKIRFDTEVKGDRFMQTGIAPDGSYTWKMEGVRPTLYNVHLLVNRPGETVFVCEGERDAETALSYGYLPTTFPNQSGFLKHCTEASIHEPLRDSDIIIFADADTAGRRYAKEKAEFLSRHCRSVKIIDLHPFADDGSDFSDWARGKSREQVQAELNEIIQRTSLYQQPQEKPTEPTEASPASDKAPSIISFATLVEMELPEPRYIIEDILPEGLAILSGAPKIGKSWLTMGLSVAIASGMQALGHFETSVGSVLHCALEDSPRRFKSRLDKILGDASPPTRAYFCNDIPLMGGGKGPNTIDFLETWIKGHQDDARLIVIDTLQKIRPIKGKHDSIYEGDYKDLEPFQQLAAAYSIAIILIHHDRKQESSDPLHNVSGSTGLTGCADTLWNLKKPDRHQSKATLFITGRDTEDRKGDLQFDKERGLWTWLGDSAELQMSRERVQIRDVLKEADRPLSITEIKDALHKDYGATKALLYKMEKVGQAQRDIQGKWLLPPEDAMYGKPERGEP